MGHLCQSSWQMMVSQTFSWGHLWTTEPSLGSHPLTETFASLFFSSIPWTRKERETMSGLVLRRQTKEEVE